MLKSTKPIVQKYHSTSHLSDEYQKDDKNIDDLVKVLGLKLDKIKELEARAKSLGIEGKFISADEDKRRDEKERQLREDNDRVSRENQQLREKIQRLQEKGKHRKARNLSGKGGSNTSGGNTNGAGTPDWKPEVSPDDATLTEVKLCIKERGGKLGKISKPRPDKGDNGDPGEGKTSPINSDNNREIGDWGERCAQRYLEEKYPSKKIVWLNENENVGIGCDFIIQENGEDIAYYEVKTKTDKDPCLFRISGRQWYEAKLKGDMYGILLISNAGKKEATITTIENPVKLWKEGKLYADPVNIEL